MIDFYTYRTLNGQAVKITLELMNAPYKTHVVDLLKGEQRRPEFLAINPSGRIPVIVDEVSGQRVKISQTGAILIYLAEQNKQLLPTEITLRAHVLQWMQFILTDISTNVFNNFHLKALVSPKQPEAGEMLKQRAINFCDEIESQLMKNKYIVGDELSLADVVAYPAVAQLHKDLLNEKHPNIIRWFKQLSEQKPFSEGMKIEQ